MSNSAPTRFPVHELIANRWSPRAFSSRVVDKETLASLFEAARWAPSSYNEQPWSFLVATKEDPENYAKMLGCLVEGNQQWAKLAPVLGLSVARLNFSRNNKPNRHAFHDVGLATANLVSEATARDLFVHMMAGIEIEKSIKTWNIPEGHEPVAGLAIGYLGDANELPAPWKEREGAPRARKPLEEMVFTGDWGKTSPIAGR
jgi:nitroreductase